ncbi:type II toxin-antitoxin system RelE/ParE family toxin [Desulfonema magnum]|uniref:Toxin-antitoxin system, toxin component domain-containing, ParE-like n=1 Tax=Desulfonema magnum TaxID=45655 RepID=A0A975BF14_9BACT|nr:type II toxin-antitoxin system RelE/ParE family toxin [Desulfonema magnum]QTA84197.1 Toxin-antitoxin system, toxin component domain-containing, ParE-like [Desulfonema magnum]
MSNIQKIIQSPLFARQKKRLQKKQIRDMDGAVRRIAEEPEVGVMKAGDLSGIRVFKFKNL